MKVPFVGGSYQGRSLNINSQRSINLYPTVDQEGGKTVVAMFNTPGLTEWYDFADTLPIRGMCVFDGNLWVVVGDTVYSITAAQVATSRGTLNSDSGYVWMVGNQGSTQLMICDGTTGYVWNGSTLAEISDTDFPGASSLTFQDGYFIVTEPDTGKWWISALNDATDWTATDYTTAEGKPDNLLAAKSHKEEVWAFGEESSEVYYNSGNSDFPFTRLPKGVLEFGINAAASVASSEDALYVLDDKLLVRQIVGYDSKIVSTPQVAYQFEKYSTTSDAIGYCYQQEKYTFYVLTFPSEKKTWVFCETTGFWHEWNSAPNNDRHRSNCHAWFDNKHLVGDWNNGKIYVIDLDVYADDSDTIQRERTATVVHQNQKTIFHHALTIDIEGGVGIATGQGSDPKAMLQWSDDGGHTWSNEYWTTMGKIGEYRKKAKWRKLGHSKERIYKFRVSDPVKVVIIDAELDATLGTH